MRLLKYLLILVILLLVIAGVLFWTLPADVAYRQGAKYFGPVVLSGVRGTLWDGHADGVSLFGRDLGEMDWRVAKSAVLRGRVVADVRIQGTDIDAAGLVERALVGDPQIGAITVRDVHFRFPASLFQPVLDLRDITLNGAISGVVSEATLRNGFVESATGNARWSEAGVSGPADARFADIAGEFAAAPGGGIAGHAKDDGSGNLAVDATFKAGMTGFDAEAILRARNGDAEVQETLRHVGEPQADGSSRLVIHGQMFKLY
jgi:general secretion pathway protein N